VDLDGAREGHVVNYKVLENIAGKTSLIIDAGGGIKSNEDLRVVFESGARMATGGSIAVKEPELFLNWLQQFGPDKIILGSDFKDGKIAISGWMEDTNTELMDFLRSWVKKGIEKTICTDISKDGVLEGTSESMYKNILDEFPKLHLVASGGVSSIEDIENLFMMGVPAVIIGKAIYEKKIDLKDLEKFI
jgi:phosphoribosylformimino-5-aminoimidazole carboxamide ribotide isomerase